MNQKGFFLVEMLAAILLIGLASAGLAAGFIQMLKSRDRIEKSFKNYDEFRILSLRLEKDVRNATGLTGYSFRAEEDEIAFPVLERDGAHFRILWVEYFLKNHALIRRSRELTSQLIKPDARERVLARNVHRLEFKFPYLGKEDEIAYESFWPEKPQGDIPRAVAMELVLGEKKFSFFKVISVPQGKWGHLEVLENAQGF